MFDYEKLTVREQKAIDRLRRVARSWPSTLSLFSNCGSLEVHKVTDDEPYTEDSYIDDIYGITNDGGDRD
jgi:hypothetical protein